MISRIAESNWNQSLSTENHRADRSLSEESPPRGSLYHFTNALAPCQTILRMSKLPPETLAKLAKTTKLVTRPKIQSWAVSERLPLGYYPAVRLELLVSAAHSCFQDLNYFTPCAQLVIKVFSSRFSQY